MSTPTAVDLFSGAGGVSQALKKHFNVLCAVEFDPKIAKTYQANHNHPLLIKDIRAIDSEELFNVTKLQPGELDLLVGTPPCQGFSRHSRKKSHENKDDRNQLILEVCRVAEILQPKYLFFENVSTIVKYEVFHDFLIRLTNLDPEGYKIDPSKPSYHVRFETINAKEYGVPQNRKRLILIGKRLDESLYPNVEAALKVSKDCPIPTTPLSFWPEKVETDKLISFIKDLPELENGGTNEDDPIHTTCMLSELNLKRIKATPKNGGSRHDWKDESLILNCHKKKNVSFGDVYGRMNFYDYAPTITCGCNRYTKGRFGHPEQDRAISLREAAIIQTFPKNYQFVGSSASIATQIGNAVPVKLAEAFIKSILSDMKIKEKVSV